MFELYKSEISRYFKLALLASIIHFAFWTYSSGIAPSDSDANNFSIIFPTILSLIFGITQMKLHTRDNHWTYLLHRPLKKWQIYFSLAAAAFSLIFLVIFSPMFIVTSYQDIFSNYVVDMRHYYFILFITIISIAVYLIGSLMVLQSLTAFFIVIIAGFMDEFTPLGHVLPLIVFISAIIFLNIKSFKPDLKQPLSTIPSVLTFSVLLTLGLGAFLQPFVTTPLANREIAFWEKSEDIHELYSIMKKPLEHTSRRNDTLLMLIRTSDNEKAIELNDYFKQRWAKQREVAKDLGVSVSENSNFWYTAKDIEFPTKNKLPEDEPAIDGRGEDEKWYFSHDDMVFWGLNIKTGKSIGWLGKSGFHDKNSPISTDDEFYNVPYAANDFDSEEELNKVKVIITKQAVYRTNFVTKQWVKIHSLEDDEYYTAKAFNSLPLTILLTNKNFYLFDNISFEDAPPSTVATHTIDISDKHSLHLASIGEHYILTSGGYDDEANTTSEIKVEFLQDENKIELIASFMPEDISVGAMPTWFKYLNGKYQLLASPFFYSIECYAEDRIQECKEVTSLGNVPKILFIVQVTCLVILLLFALRLNLRRNLIILWLLMAIVIGTPTIIIFIIINKINLYKAIKSFVSRKPLKKVAV